MFFLYLSLRYINSVTRIVVLCCGIFILTTIFLVYRVITEDSKYFLKNNRKIIFYFKRNINGDYTTLVNELINNYSDYYIMKLVDESYIIFKLEDFEVISVNSSLGFVCGVRFSIKDGKVCSSDRCARRGSGPRSARRG